MTCTWSQRKESRRGKKGVTGDVNSSSFHSFLPLHGLGHFLYINMPQKCSKVLFEYGQQMKIPEWKGKLTTPYCCCQEACAEVMWHLGQAGFAEAWLPRGVSGDPVPVWLFLLQQQSDSLHKNSVKKGKVGAGGRKQIKQSQSMKAFKTHDSCVLSHVFPQSEGQVGDKRLNLHPGPQEWRSLKNSKGGCETRLGSEVEG